MKKIMIIAIMALLFTGCLANWSQTIMLKDSKGNSYAITTVYNDKTHGVCISISYEDKKYTCEAIKDDAFTGNMLVETDLDILNKTGMGLIVYKGQKYSCKIENTVSS